MQCVGILQAADVLTAITARLRNVRQEGDSPATIQYPTNNTTLAGASDTFTWNLGSGVAEVQLYVGTSPGQTDIFTQWEGIHTSQTVTGLPTNGQPVYLTLRSKIKGLWQDTPYTYTASGSTSGYTLTVNSTNPSSGVGITVSPADNSALGNGTTPSFVRTYNKNAQVTLTAPSTASGNSFSSWTNCDQVSSTTCTVTITAARTVTANYTTSAGTYTLTVNSSNPSSGVGITVSPTDKNGSGNGTTSFVRSYNQAAQVTLIAPSTAGETASRPGRAAIRFQVIRVLLLLPRVKR